MSSRFEVLALKSPNKQISAFSCSVVKAIRICTGYKRSMGANGNLVVTDFVEHDQPSF